MARKKRIHLPGGIYHVMLRGNDGDPIFYSEKDKSYLCSLIEEGVNRFGHKIYSFCFMTNHLHFAIEVRDVSISRIVQNLAFRYTRYINFNYDRIGHLFQGRFKSILIESGEHLKELIRYIHLNPVRARIVSSPEQYSWSSHNYFMGKVEFSWLCNHIMNMFGNDFNEAISNYFKYISQKSDVNEVLNFETNESNYIPKDDHYLEWMIKYAEKNKPTNIGFTELIKEICERYKVTEEMLQNSKKSEIVHARSVLALMVKEISSLSLEGLAEILKRDSSGLSKLAKKIELKALDSKNIDQELNDLRKWVRSLEPKRSSDVKISSQN